MRQRGLELRPHCLAVGLEGLVAGFHLDKLLGAGEDGGDCGDEANGLEVVGAAADVGEGGAHAIDKRGELKLCCGGIEDVEAPGQGEEGNGEVHCSKGLASYGAR